MVLARRIITLSLVLFSVVALAKKKSQYPVSDIPENLKSGAKAIVRLDKHVFHLKSEKSAEEEVEYVITVLNENGLRNAYFSEFYNSLMEVGSISATVYDAQGNKIHRIKAEDILDIKATGSSSIFDDNRVKTFNPKTKQYPFTVAYSFKRSYKGIFHFPTFHLFQGYSVGVQKAIYQIKAKNLDDIRVNVLNVEQEAEKGTDDEWQTQTWTFSDFKGIRYETLSPSVLLYTPTIELSPRNINIKGFKGKTESWKSFGAFVQQLITGRDELAEETVNEVKQLVANTKDDNEKVSILYKYMQNKTRYISIQVGMGGWQPFEAETVDRLGYGDCKALTNYMKALLKVAGIPSIYTLVKAGNDARLMNRDFSANQFNHAILCVPMAKDTIWLECTNQQFPCGFLGDFTDDRDVLLIKEDGGEVAHTTVYSQNENKCRKTNHVYLDENGNALFYIQYKFSGVQYKKAFPLLYMDKKDQKKYIERRISIPSFIVRDFSFEDHQQRFPQITQKVNLLANNYSTVMGGKLIVPLNRVSKVHVPSFIRNRKSKLDLRRGYTYADSTIFHIPKGLKLNKLPDAKEVKSKFGHYATECSQPSDSILIFKRTLTLNKSLYASSEYINYRKFMQQVNRLDNQKCLLTK